MLHYGYGASGFWMIIRLLGHILFGGLIIYAIIHLFKTGVNRGKTEALSILDQRYAQGEISDEEYKHKKDTLRQ